MPRQEDSLSKAVGQVHWRYTLLINRRQHWRGHLWQGRFNSFVLHDSYLRNVIRYVELNPVRAGIVKDAGAYKWSSAKPHIERSSNAVLDHFQLLDDVKDWKEYLRAAEDVEGLALLRKHLSTCRPLGDADFLSGLSKKLGVDLFPQKPGRKTAN